MMSDNVWVQAFFDAVPMLAIVFVVWLIGGER